MPPCHLINPPPSAEVSDLDQTSSARPLSLPGGPPVERNERHPSRGSSLSWDRSSPWESLSAIPSAWWGELFSRRVTLTPACDCGGCPKSRCRYPSPMRLEVLAGHSLINGIHLECMIPPPMSRKEFSSLCDSIRQVGQLVPVRTDPAGYLIDGRYRLAACRALRITPIIEADKYAGWPGPYRRASSFKRLERYRLDLGERLQLGEELLPVFKAAKWRGRTARTGRPPRQRTPRTLIPKVPSGRSTDVLAAMLGLGRQTLERYLNLPSDLKADVIDQRQNVHQATLELQRRTRVASDRSTPPNCPR